MGRRNDTPLTDEQSKLAGDNFGLAFYAVERVRPDGTEATDDLLWAAVGGLIEAARSFREQYKTKFSTYAVTMMRRHMKAELRQGLIHVPKYQLDGARSYGLEYADDAARTRNIASLSMPPGSDYAHFEVAAPEPSEPERGLIQRHRIERACAILNAMPERRRQIAEMHGKGTATEEIARAFGVTPRTIRDQLKLIRAAFREQMGELMEECA